MRLPRRGTGLGTTLIVASLAMTLALVLAATAFAQLNAGNRVYQGSLALNAAESVLALAVDRLSETDGLFGQVDQAGYGEILEYQDPNHPEVRARIAFQPSLAAAQGLPYSLNNLGRGNSQPGWGGSAVPSYTAQLLARATAGGVERTVELQVRVPPFPYAIASEGEVQGDNLLVAAVERLTDVPAGGPQGIDPSRLLEGHLASNLNESTAVLLGTGTNVTGRARAAGGIEVSPQAVVGQLLPNSKPVAIPHLTIAEYDNRNQPDTEVVTGTQADPLVGTSLRGNYRSGEDLFVQGDLHLDRAVLFVDGDLTIDGGLDGLGLVACSGKLKITGCATLSPTSKVAALAGTGVELVGQNQAGSFFQGVVYTQGPFQANRVSMLGAFVAGPGGSLELTDSSAVQVEDVADKIEFVVPKPPLSWASAFPVNGATGEFLVGSVTILTARVEYGGGDGSGPVRYRVYPSSAFAVAHPEYTTQGGSYVFTNDGQWVARIEEILAFYMQVYTDAGAPIAVATVQGFIDLVPQLSLDLPQQFEDGGSNGIYQMGYYSNGSTQGGPDQTVSFSLNEFLSFEQKAQVTLWKPR